MSGNKTSLSYKDAGDIDAGNALVERIKGAVKRTRRPEVNGWYRWFWRIVWTSNQIQNNLYPVSGTDGVGTKLRLALDMKNTTPLGIDWWHNVNDLIVQGAEPLFFPDYYATGKLDVDTAAEVVSGIADGCLRWLCT